jgi:hypothetical protein
LGAALDVEFSTALEAEKNKRRRAERLLVKHQADRAILMEALEAHEQRSADSGSAGMSRLFSLEAELRQLRARSVSLMSERDEALLRADRNLSAQKDGEEGDAPLPNHPDRLLAASDAILSRDATITALRGRALALDVEVRQLRTPAPSFDEKSVVQELLSDIEERDRELRQLRKVVAENRPPPVDPLPGPQSRAPAAPTLRVASQFRQFSVVEVLAICFALGAALLLSFLRVFVTTGCNGL